MLAEVACSIGATPDPRILMRNPLVFQNSPSSRNRTADRRNRPVGGFCHLTLHYLPTMADHM
jgi:hypothetical protein